MSYHVAMRLKASARCLIPRRVGGDAASLSLAAPSLIRGGSILLIELEVRISLCSLLLVVSTARAGERVSNTDRERLYVAELMS